MDVEESKPTSEIAGSIKAINKETVHKICSGQVVLSLAIAVKELVENAIDAGATLVEIKVREQGLESVEVADNGCGVEESNFEGLTAKYHTSKLRKFSDLYDVATFGFRGEALSSLCALSDMVISTKHKSATVGTKLQLNHRGEIVKKSACARQVGTTVTLSQLFASLPVRKREFQRNIKKEFVKMCQIMQGYGLIAYGVRIILTNHSAKGGKMTIMSTNGSHALLDNIVAIFGAKQKYDLLKVRQPIESNETLTQEVIKSLDPSINVNDDEIDSLRLQRFRFDGYVSSCSHGSGRSTRDRQFFFINGRPCEPKQIIKLVNDTYRRYNMHQSPFIVLNVILEQCDVDVNLTPDKRQVLVNNETILRLALKKSLLSTFGQIPSTLQMQNSTITSNFCGAKESSKAESVETLEDDGCSDASSNDADFEKRVCTERGDSMKYAIMLSQWRTTGSTDDDASASQSVKRKHQAMDDISMRTLKMKKIQEYLSQDIQSNCKNYGYKSESDGDDNDNQYAQNAKNYDYGNQSSEGMINNQNVDSRMRMEQIDKPFKEEIASEESFRIDCKVKAIDTTKGTLKIEKFAPLNITKSGFADLPTSKIVSDNSLMFAANTHESPSNLDRSTDKENEPEELLVDDSPVLPSVQRKDATISTSLSEIAELMQRENELEQQSKQNDQIKRLRFKAQIDPTKNKAAEQELKTEISKDDFIRMDVIGQFNLGFIIVHLGDDLFIIDQHATDEKYNFETLQKTTCLENQKLVVPQPLELTAINEMIIIDNLHVFEMNGFRFEIDLKQPVTKRIKLVGKPFSRNWEFGKDDIDELIFMLQEGSGEASSIATCRPSRVRAMFASRACRSSVMIGTALKKTDMRRLIDHMGTIDQPWVSLSSYLRFRKLNCPHGRPTIRHLINLEMLSLNEENTKAADEETEIIFNEK